jgi:hypothetical protein
MSTKSLVVGSQVSLGGGAMGASVKPYPMHSKENSSSSSFLFKRHIYSHTERMGLSGFFGGDTLQGVLECVGGVCCWFREKREGDAFSVTSNDDEATNDDTRRG